MIDSPLQVLFAASALALVIAAVGYKLDREEAARATAVTGFGLFGLVMVYLTANYATGTGSDRYFLMAVTGTGALICVQAMRLVITRWERAGQITTAVAITSLFVVPMEIAPAIPITLQELFAAQTLIVLDWLGYQGTLASYGGGMTQIQFDDGVAINIIRECTGVDGLALFTGLVLAARTTWRKKLLGLGFVVTVVYLVNSVRLVFINAAMADDWFGPYLTSENTLEMTYLVAEVFIGQLAVILVTIAGFIVLARLIPDLMEFVTDLLGTFVPENGLESVTPAGRTN